MFNEWIKIFTVRACLPAGRQVENHPLNEFFSTRVYPEFTEGLEE